MIFRRSFWLILILAPLASAQPLRMLADTWAPFTDKEGAAPGFMVEMAVAAARQAGLTVDYRMVPWSRAVAEVKQGQAELLLAVLSRQVQQEGLVLCPEPFAYDRNQFFTLTTSAWVYSVRDSLAGQRLGVVQDYQYGDTLNRYIADYGADESRVSFSVGDIPIQTSLKKLAAGRVTAIIDDPNVVYWNARQLGIAGRLRLAGTADQPVGIYLAISPQLPGAAALAERLARALREFKQTQAYAELLAKYRIDDTVHP